jgi:hypothetical protein
MNRSGAVRHSRDAVMAALLVALLVTGLGVAIDFVPVAAGATPAKAATTTTVPAGKWDPRIEPIAKEVAKLRKLGFEHPVPVEFLPSKEFDKQVTVDAGKLSKAAKQASAQATARLASLAFVPHSSDLVAQENQLQSSSVLALYLPTKKKVFVRGTDLDTPAKKVTVAHELTHALQDQHFDLTKLGTAADKSHSSDSLKALVEGDAVRVQELYAKTMSQADQDQYQTENNDTATQAQGETTAAGVPSALTALAQSPYALGPAMLKVVEAEKGESAIDGLFRSPPTDDLSYVQPTSLVDHPQIAKVAPPKASGKGEKQRGSDDTFGSFALYLALAQQLDPVAALRIADGWGGDAMIDYTVGAGKDATRCIRAAFAGRTADDTAAILQGLQTWSAAQPAGSASAAARDGKVVFSSCDVAAPRSPAPHDAQQAMTLLASRNELLSVFAGQGAGGAAALCAADGTVRDPTFQPFLDLAAIDPTAQPDQQTIAGLRQAVTRILTSCVRNGKAGSSA